MTLRDTNLELLIESCREAFGGAPVRPAARAAGLVFSRLAGREGESVALAAQRLDVCHHHLDAALSAMAAQASPLPELAAAFSAVEGSLRWDRRRGADPEDRAFFDGHVNAMLIGPGGIEQREDVWVGATLMAPHVTYPEHSHPPEEAYLALTGGQWWNAGMDWTEPGPSGTFYNPPGIRHAMRSGASAFLALWFLPVG